MATSNLAAAANPIFNLTPVDKLPAALRQAVMALERAGQAEGRFSIEAAGMIEDVVRSAPPSVETAAFQLWFGASRVTEDGEPYGKPLAVYHGTPNASFNVFDPQRGGATTGVRSDYHFFTSSYRNAEFYRDYGDAGEIKQVYLNLQNPLIIEAGESNGRSPRQMADEVVVKDHQNGVEHPHDGLIVRDYLDGDTYSDIYLAFEPTQIKSATDNVGAYAVLPITVAEAARFDMSQKQAAIAQEKGDIRFSREINPVFFSALARSIVSSMPRDKEGSIGVEQAQAWLTAKAKEGRLFKAAELEWSGLTDWLKTLAGKVPLSEMAAFVDTHGVQVREVLKDSPTGMRQKELEQIRETLNEVEDRFDAGVKATPAWQDGRISLNDMRVKARRGIEIGEVSQDLVKEYARIWRQYQAAEFARDGKDGEVRHGSYVLPGAEDYRELLLTLPSSGTDRRATLSAQHNIMVDELAARLGKPVNLSDVTADMTPDERSRFDTLDEQIRTLPIDQQFSSSHWGERNVLVHLRFNGRTDPQGRRVLMVEEIQSDWGQVGKRDGFGTTVGYTVIDQNRNQRGDFSDKQGAIDYLAHPPYFIDPSRSTIKEVLKTGVPAGPFVDKTERWVALAVKRLIRYSVDHGYDRVAFISGAQSVDRYNLRKTVESIEYKKAEDQSSGELEAFDRSGAKIISRMAAINELPGILGKDVAARLLESPSMDSWSDTRNVYMLSGEDITLSDGGGMAIFYDQIVPNIVNDVIRKLGGETVGEVEIKLTERPRVLDRVCKDMGYGGWNMFLTEEQKQLALAEHAKDAHRGFAVLTQRGFDITDEMRESALAGLPMFSRPDVAGDAVPRRYDRAWMDNDLSGVAARAYRIALAEQTHRLSTLQDAGAFSSVRSKAVYIYRGVPSDTTNPVIRPGDWVSPDKDYAREHGTGRTGKSKVLKLRVSPDEVVWAGTDQNEWIYVPKGMAEEGETAIGLLNRLGEEAFEHPWDGSVPHVQPLSWVLLASSHPIVRAMVGKETGSAMKDGIAKFVGEFGSERYVQYLKGRAISGLQVVNGVVANIYTDPDYRLQGSGRALFAVAQRSNPSLRHSEYLGVDGAAFAESVKPLQKIETPQFKEWFGASVVTHHDHSPRVVYHGTGSDITQFSYEFTGRGNDSMGSGFYFTDDTETASSYGSKVLDSTTPKLGGSNANVLPVYVSIKKPITPDLMHKLSASQVRRIIEAAPDLNDRLQNFGDVNYEGFAKILHGACQGYMNDDTPLIKNLHMLSNDFFPHSVKEFNRAVRKVLGYDGVVQKVGDHTHYVAWFPEQIKSAVGNNGQFSPTTPDIRFDRGLFDTADEDATVVASEMRAVKELAAFFNARVAVVRTSSDSSFVFNGANFGGMTWINEKAKRPLHTLFGHELLHQMKQDRPDLYAGLREAVAPMLVNRARYVEQKGLGQHGLAYVEEEMIADVVGERFAELQFWTEVAQANPSLFTQIASYMTDVVGRLGKTLRVITGSAACDQFVIDLDAARSVIAQTVADYALYLRDHEDIAEYDLTSVDPREEGMRVHGI